MSSVSESLQRISSELGRTASRGSQLAAQIEAGQSEMPLADGFQRLSQPQMNEPVTAILIGFDPQTTSLALSHLLGQDYHVCKVVVPGMVGYNEVTLQERGFSVTRGNYHRDFEEVGDFLQALQQQDMVQADSEKSWLDPLKFKLASKTNRRGLRLLVPEGLRSLKESPALLSTLADQAAWLFVGGPAQAVISEADLTRLKMLKDRVISCQPIFIESDGAAPTAVPSLSASAWAVALGSPIQPPISISADTNPAVWEDPLRLLTADESELRRALLESNRRLHLESTVQLLVEDLNRQANSLRTKKRLISSGLVARPEDDQKSRTVGDEARTRLQDDLDALRRKLEELARLSLLNGGATYNALLQASEEIAVSDLTLVEHETTIRLTVSEARVEHLRQVLQRAGRERLNEDSQLVCETVEATLAEIATRLEPVSGSKCRFQVDFPDQKKLSDAVVALARPDVRYRGEIARPTVMHRINEARQPLMLVMMCVMLFGGVAGLLGGKEGKEKLQAVVSLALLPVFIGGLIWTGKAFKQERHHLIEKELERLRNDVFQELRRVISDILREEQSLLNQYFQQTARSIQQQIVQHLQQAEQQRRRAQETQRQQVNDQSRSLDERTRQLETQKRECDELLRGLERSKSDLTQQTMEALRKKV